MARRTEVVHPDFEISIKRGTGEEVLLVGIFINEDGTVDFGVGWDGETELNGVRALLESTGMAISSLVSWMPIENLRGENERAESVGDELPF